MFQSCSSSLSLYISCSWWWWCYLVFWIYPYLSYTTQYGLSFRFCSVSEFISPFLLFFIQKKNSFHLHFCYYCYCYCIIVFHGLKHRPIYSINNNQWDKGERIFFLSFLYLFLSCVWVNFSRYLISRMKKKFSNPVARMSEKEREREKLIHVLHPVYQPTSFPLRQMKICCCFLLLLGCCFCCLSVGRSVSFLFFVSFRFLELVLNWTRSFYYYYYYLDSAAHDPHDLYNDASFSHSFFIITGVVGSSWFHLISSAWVLSWWCQFFPLNLLFYALFRLILVFELVFRPFCSHWT